VAQIAGGKAVFPDGGQVSRPGESATAVGGFRAHPAVDQAGAVGELAHGGEGSGKSPAVLQLDLDLPRGFGRD